MAKKDRTLNEVFEMVSLISDQLEGTRKEIKDLKTTVNHIEQDVLTVKEDVDAIAKTVSRDSLTLRSHARRIVTLERSR
ncbi:MAG TPA: hypothetical protein VJJ20_01575 [Candidatus Paceibacterota bacterium]